MANPDIIAPPQMMGYISLVQSEPVMVALENNSRLVFDLLGRIPADRYDYAYAEGKWTVKQVLQHLIDCERVFALRTLWFSRDPGTSLPGFEENGWAARAPITARPWGEMLDEFRAVRTSTALLLRSLPEEIMTASSLADDNPINAIACAYVCSGHVQHHINVLGHRYGIR